MADIYQYRVFFRCPGLNAELKKRIETYFSIRRKSGGGECGLVTCSGDEACSVAFRERQAQQRVLERREHVLEFAGGRLVLTVQGSPAPNSKAASPNLDLSSSQQGPQSFSTSSLLESGEEYELHLDTYLVRYLNECPKAGKELEEKLASVASCSAQLYPDEGRILLRSLAQPGAVDEVSDWKAEVSKIFDGYQCYYEMDSHKIKALLQSCSSTDEVKVYSDVGMAVVVGEHSQVQVRLMDVEDRSSPREKHTTVCPIGKAKLRLLWKEIEPSLEDKFPKVKVTKGDAGKLVLEGSVEDILKAGDWISSQATLVFERKVSDMSPYFLAFLRKAYEDPGTLGNLLEVDDLVEVELGDTELRFFSLSADKLEDTEKKLKEKLKEVKNDLPNWAAVPHDLRQNLKSITNKMNQVQHRAQVVFGSGRTVILLGHTKEVEELSEAVTQFILDQARIEDTVILPFPELQQKLTEILQMNGFDHSGVTFYPLQTSSPMLALEGPAGKVAEVRNRLGPFLASLVQTRVTIDLPGAARYFLTPSGREEMLRVARSQRCSVQLQEKSPHQNVASLSLREVNTTVASYTLQDGLQVQVCHGDITKQDVDAIVNAANEELKHHGGVAAALSKAGGPEVQKESRTLVKQSGKVPTGEVVVTTGGNLKCKKLLHAVGPVGGRSSGRERVLLEKTVLSALSLAEMMEFESLAMPCISSGQFGVPVPVCSEAIVTAVKTFGSQRGQSLRTIVLIDNREEVVRAMQEACDRLLQGIASRNVTSDSELQLGAAAQEAAVGGGGVYVEIQQAFQFAQETNPNPPQGANDEVTSMFSGVMLQMVHGNIVHECTDAIINTTDFSTNQSGVSKAILTAAGPVVQAEFARAGLPAHILATGPGSLNCREIFHTSFKADPQIIRKTCKKILKLCESKGYGSVAFPAINTGAAGLQPHTACKAMLDGITSAITNLSPKSLSLIRIVILQQPIFQAFRSELGNRFRQTVTPRLTLREKAKQKFKQLHDKISRTPATSAPQGQTVISIKPLPAVVSVIACSADTIRMVKTDLDGILQKHLVERELAVQDYANLDTMELAALQAKVKVLEISMEYVRRQSPGSRPENPARHRSGGDVYVIKGLKDDVLSVTEFVNKAIQKALCKDLQDKDEAMLAFKVQWSMQDVKGTWHELNLHENYLLEEAHETKQIFVNVMAPEGMKMKVNLRTKEAIDELSGFTYKVKRINTQTDLELPSQWEPMDGELFKKVELDPNSAQYQIVAQEFLKTAKYTIRKIERVQNSYLWQAYSLCQQRIIAKNGLAELGEKSLYHGTSAESCSCIEKDRFDRNFAGAHGAAHGKGVYFAVNADYSAKLFSPPDSSDLKRLYVARVLTGRYTVGRRGMKCPPPRGSDTTDCFDSVVDDQQQPSMFVIFHDDQAYPEYLITFS